MSFHRGRQPGPGLPGAGGPPAPLLHLGRTYGPSSAGWIKARTWTRICFRPLLQSRLSCPAKNKTLLVYLCICFMEMEILLSKLWFFFLLFNNRFTHNNDFDSLYDSFLIHMIQKWQVYFPFSLFSFHLSLFFFPPFYKPSFFNPVLMIRVKKYAKEMAGELIGNTGNITVLEQVHQEVR